MFKYMLLILFSAQAYAGGDITTYGECSTRYEGDMVSVNFQIQIDSTGDKGEKEKKIYKKIKTKLLKVIENENLVLNDMRSYSGMRNEKPYQLFTTDYSVVANKDKTDSILNALLEFDKLKEFSRKGFFVFSSKELKDKEKTKCIDGAIKQARYKFNKIYKSLYKKEPRIKNVQIFEEVSGRFPMSRSMSLNKSQESYTYNKQEVSFKVKVIWSFE